MYIYYKTDTGEVVAIRNDATELINEGILDTDYKVKFFTDFITGMYKVNLETLLLEELPEEPIEELPEEPIEEPIEGEL